jgi:hypothetical protein
MGYEVRPLSEQGLDVGGVDLEVLPPVDRLGTLPVAAPIGVAESPASG